MLPAPVTREESERRQRWDAFLDAYSAYLRDPSLASAASLRMAGEALESGHPGLLALGFTKPDADGLWRFAEYSYGAELAKRHQRAGRLAHDSNMRPNRLFTADSNIILYRAGVLKPAKLQEVIAKIMTIVST